MFGTDETAFYTTIQELEADKEVQAMVDGIEYNMEVDTHDDSDELLPMKKVNQILADKLVMIRETPKCQNVDDFMMLEIRLSDMVFTKHGVEEETLFKNLSM
jgi:hypothetical protein